MTIMDDFKCPRCGAERPYEMHLDWCDYEGPDFSDTEVILDD